MRRPVPAIRSLPAIGPGLLLVAFLSIHCTGDPAGPQEEPLRGPYLGQAFPGTTPEVFARGIVSTGSDWAITFSPDGRECFFNRTIDHPVIMTMREEDDGWIGPEIAPFSGSTFDIEPHIVPGGDLLYFGSERPHPDTDEPGLYQWVVEKTDSGWSDPRPMEPPLNDVWMMYPSVAESGNIYFTAGDGVNQWISMSRWIDGAYQEPEALGPEINSLESPAHPFIDPAERYLIFDINARTEGDQYLNDLYISFRNPDGSWTEAIDMGPPVNTASHECCAFVTRDGAWLFFYRTNDIYWVDAAIIETCRP